MAKACSGRQKIVSKGSGILPLPQLLKAVSLQASPEQRAKAAAPLERQEPLVPLPLGSKYIARPPPLSTEEQVADLFK